MQPPNFFFYGKGYKLRSLLRLVPSSVLQYSVILPSHFLFLKSTSHSNAAMYNVLFNVRMILFTGNLAGSRSEAYRHVLLQYHNRTQRRHDDPNGTIFPPDRTIHRYYWKKSRNAKH